MVKVKVKVKEADLMAMCMLSLCSTQRHHGAQQKHACRKRSLQETGLAQLAGKSPAAGASAVAAAAAGAGAAAAGSAAGVGAAGSAAGAAVASAAGAAASILGISTASITWDTACRRHQQQMESAESNDTCVSSSCNKKEQRYLMHRNEGKLAAVRLLQRQQGAMH